MVRYWWLLIILTVSAEAQPLIVDPAIGAASLKAPAGGAPGVTYLVSEDFEGTGLPSNWWTNLVDAAMTFDCTDALVGTQSLWETNLAHANTPQFAVQTNIWVHYAYKWTNAPAGSASTMALLDSASNIVAYVQMRSTPSFRFYHGTANATSATNNAGGAIATGTMYYIWLHYGTGGGTDGILDGYVSTTTTRGAPVAQITTGTSTAGVAYLRLQGYTSPLFYDKVRVDDAEIGNNPE